MEELAVTTASSPKLAPPATANSKAVPPSDGAQHRHLGHHKGVLRRGLQDRSGSQGVAKGVLRVAQAHVVGLRQRHPARRLGVAGPWVQALGRRLPHRRLQGAHVALKGAAHRRSRALVEHQVVVHAAHAQAVAAAARHRA